MSRLSNLQPNQSQNTQHSLLRTHSSPSSFNSMSSLPSISHLSSNNNAPLHSLTQQQHFQSPILRPPKRLSSTQLYPTPLPLPLTESKVLPPQPSNPTPRQLPDRQRTPITSSHNLFTKRIRRLSSVASSSTGNLPDLAIHSSSTTSSSSSPQPPQHPPQHPPQQPSQHQRQNSLNSITNVNPIPNLPNNMNIYSDTILRSTHRRRASESATFYSHVKKNPQSTLSSNVTTRKRLLDLDELRLGKMLGTGATATVVKAEPKPGTKTANVIPAREVALKVIKKKGLSKRAAFYLQREISIHRIVQNHPNVVSFYDMFEDSQHIYLAMEFLKGSDLYTVLKRERRGLHEKIALIIIIQVLDALQYMHSQGYSHRDIKPENIMFMEKPNFNEGKHGNVRLIDFGLACARDPNKPAKDRMSSEKCGTIRYAAPEIITQASYIPEFVDMWSVGVVLYSIIAHRNPYTGRTEREVLHETQNTPLSFENMEWNHVSDDTKKFIRDLLAKRPTNRPTAAVALQEARRILQMISTDQYDNPLNSDSVQSQDQQRTNSVVAGFPSNVTPEAGSSTRRSDKPGNDGSGGSGSAPSRSNSEHENGQQPSFIDGVIAWLSGSSPDRTRSENSS